MKDARHSDSNSKEYLATKEYLMVPPQAIIMKDGRTVAVDARRGGGCVPWSAHGGSPVEFVDWAGTWCAGTDACAQAPRGRPPSHRRAGAWGLGARVRGLLCTGVQVRGG